MNEFELVVDSIAPLYRKDQQWIDGGKFLF